jgi:hypothetical protein
MGPRDANGIIWVRGDMSDSEWGVIERTYFDGEQWMVCGHDISAPWVPADSIRHAPMRTASQREGDMVALPVDADGEVIHVGDKVESDTREDGAVVGVEYRDGDRVRKGGRPHNWNAPTWCDPAEYRHYNKPTIEGVLREFVNEWIEAESEGDVFAKYAAKLREVMADE